METWHLNWALNVGWDTAGGDAEIGLKWQMFIKSYRTFYSQIFFFLSSELQGKIFPKPVFLLYIFSIDQYESATKSIYFWNHLNLNCYLVAQSCLALCDTMDCSPPDSSVHGIFQARTLEWVAISFSIKPVLLYEDFSAFYTWWSSLLKIYIFESEFFIVLTVNF